MTNEVQKLQLDHVANVLEELEAAFYDIPFENSDFQNRAFVVASQQTPGRAYRAIGLRMFAKIRSIKEYLIQKERNELDIEEKQEKINAGNINRFDKRRLELDIMQITEGFKWSEKLLNDALRELSCLHVEFKRMPKYTREQFENEESAHYHARLERARLTGGGAYESLLNMNEDLPAMEKRIEHALEFIVSGIPRHLLAAAGLEALESQGTLKQIK